MITKEIKNILDEMCQNNDALFEYAKKTYWNLYEEKIKELYPEYDGKAYYNVPNEIKSDASLFIKRIDKMMIAADFSISGNDIKFYKYVSNTILDGDDLFTMIDGSDPKYVSSVLKDIKKSNDVVKGYALKYVMALASCNGVINKDERNIIESICAFIKG